MSESYSHDRVSEDTRVLPRRVGRMGRTIVLCNCKWDASWILVGFNGNDKLLLFQLYFTRRVMDDK